jgi:hypothetical protein
LKLLVTGFGSNVCVYLTREQDETNVGLGSAVCMIVWKDETLEE